MTTTKQKTIRFRTTVQKNQKPTIDAAGGDRGAGIIEGLSLITKGEALGHGMWIDDQFVSDVGEALSDAGRVKSRFAHPDLSSDGLGRVLGRVTPTDQDAEGKVLGDLHFYKTAHNTPDGDLANYVMELAEEDSTALGASIVFEMDYEAFDEFNEGYRTDSFESPDPLNTDNLPHARLGSLLAVDIVDEPAANPDGMFHEDGKLLEAESLAEYALGLSERVPALSRLESLDPDKVKGFVARFLSSHNLEVREMSDDVTVVEPQTATLDELESLNADAEFVLSCLRENVTLAEARAKLLEKEQLSNKELLDKIADLSVQNDELKQENAKLKAALASAESAPLSSTDGDTKPTGFAGNIKMPGQ